MYPVLTPGTLVKPQVRGLTFHWLRVIEDPGPEHHPKRIITLARTEPERANQWLKVRRDRVHADASRMSVFDVKPTPTTAAAQNGSDRRAARQPRARGKMADPARSGPARSPYPHRQPSLDPDINANPNGLAPVLAGIAWAALHHPEPDPQATPKQSQANISSLFPTTKDSKPCTP